MPEPISDPVVRICIEHAHKEVLFALAWNCQGGTVQSRLCDAAELLGDLLGLPPGLRSAEPPTNERG